MRLVYNTEYALHEFKTHGEYALMEKLQHASLNTIFDVGCNIGEWSRMTRSFHQTSKIHMFELLPATFQKLLHNNAVDENMMANSYGLSCTTQEIPIRVMLSNDRVTTTVTEMKHPDSIVTTGLVRHPDSYLQYYDINYIDYLKIDTEGHEYQVLQGFSSLIEEGKVACIQFEYGFINVLTRHLMIDFYKFLEPYGYVIGPLTPSRVDFRSYSIFKEDFQGPDYVAVHKSRQDIIDLIQ